MGSHFEAQTFLGFLIVSILIWLLSSSLSDAYQFHVGGRDGWVLKPSEDYNHWAQRIRFQVNDNLFFKYKKGVDLVMVVKKEDYDSCNILNPIVKMDDGDSIFKLDRSGPFYFISGNADNCHNGQKLIVVVLAVTHHNKPLPSSPQPQPSDDSPQPQPSDDSPAPSPSDASTRSSSNAMGLGLSVGLIWILSKIVGLV